MLAGGRWVPERPEARRRGYHLSALYAPIGLGPSWLDLAREWVTLHRGVDGKPRKADPAHPTAIYATTLCDYSAGMHLVQGILLALLAAAFAGKLAGAGLTARLVGFDNRDAMAIGAAMNARGAVEIIIADIALRAGLFDRPHPTPPAIDYLFSAIVIMAIVTTLVSPLALRRLLHDRR